MDAIHMRWMHALMLDSKHACFEIINLCVARAHHLDRSIEDSRLHCPSDPQQGGNKSVWSIVSSKEIKQLYSGGLATTLQ